jgi:hypothetical protein
MKKLVATIAVALSCGSVFADAIVEDDFNSYTNGSIVGQGGWESYINGNNFVVQEATVFEGANALHNNSSGDSVIGKKGILRTDGIQRVYVKTKNRNNWSDSLDESFQFRMNKYLWSSPGTPPGIQSFTSLTFKKDGNIAYYNDFTGKYENFAIYEDNIWTLAETEWRSDATARYRVNDGTWTNWYAVPNRFVYAGFDYVGFDFQNGGLGGVYIDALGANPVPEPSTLALLFTGLIAGGLFFLRRK